MKHYTISFPGEYNQHVVETWSEEQILNSYWDYWCERMTEAGKDPEVHTFQDCIDDWCAIHWAYETDEWGRKIYTDCDCGCNTPVASTPEKMLRFLADRMQHAGIDHAVCEIYARDIRKILEEHYEKGN